MQLIFFKLHLHIFTPIAMLSFKFLLKPRQEDYSSKSLFRFKFRWQCHVRIANEIQGSRFASSVIGSLLYHLLSTEELPLKPSSSVSPVKAVTEHYEKSTLENTSYLCFQLVKIILLFIPIQKGLKK